MQLVNEFVVPRGIDETWAVLTDVERIAPAMPGAQLTGVEDGKYNGKVKVKVGPVTAAYAGVASFRELDEATHHMVLDAAGKESSGRGRASAVVSADLTSNGSTETKVRVTTELTISGPLAQFGRGAIAEVSARLLNQFVENLKQTVLVSSPAAVELAAATAPATDAAPLSTSAVADPVPTSGGASASGSTSVSGEPNVSYGTSAPPVSAGAGSPVAGVNLLTVAAWPIAKRVIPLVVAIVVIIVLIVVFA